MIQFPKNGNYVLAFVTGETRDEVQKLSPEPLVHVYVPTSPNPTSGYFLLVPEREVESVDMSVEEAMKLIVSGGLYSSGKAMGVPTFDSKEGSCFSDQKVEVKTG
jgi:uncharacterized membrane protein